MTKPTPTPTPKPVFTSGSWQGQITFTSGHNPISSILQLGTVQNGAFTGMMFGPGIGEGPSSGDVSGQDGALNSFNPRAQNRLQQAINLGGNGTGVYVEFTITSYGRIPIIFPLNSVFDAVVFRDGSLRGVWFNPGDTQPDGTFIFTKGSQGFISTDYTLSLMKAPALASSRDISMRNYAVS